MRVSKEVASTVHGLDLHLDLQPAQQLLRQPRGTSNPAAQGQHAQQGFPELQGVDLILKLQPAQQLLRLPRGTLAQPLRVSMPNKLSLQCKVSSSCSQTGSD